MKNKSLRPLNKLEQRYICQFIRILIPIARDDHHSMRGIARWQIALAMWRWTADAVDIRSGKVRKDAFKYNVDFRRHTQGARDALPASLYRLSSLPVEKFPSSGIRVLGRIL